MRKINLLMCAGFLLVGCGGEVKDDLQRNASGLISGYGHCPAINDNQFCVCEAPNWLGPCEVGNFGNWDTMNYFPTVGNDHVSSVVVGGNIKARMYQDGSFHYSFVANWFTPPAPYVDYVGPSAVAYVGNDMNDKISSIRTDWLTDSCAHPKINQAVFYAAAYGLTTLEDCVVHNAGAGALNTPVAMGLVDNTLSSVALPRGIFATLCQNNNLTGACITLGSATQLTPDGFATYEMPSGWNDVTSSAVITADGF